MTSEVVRENNIMGVFKQLAIMFLQRRLALTDRFRLPPHVPADDARPNDPDQNGPCQHEQRPKQVRELRRDGRFRRGSLGHGQHREEEHVARHKYFASSAWLAAKTSLCSELPCASIVTTAGKLSTSSSQM